jgi:two-component system sensor histidine kinase/response regulator
MRQIPVVLLCLAQALVAIGPLAAEPLSLSEAERTWIAARDEVPVAVLGDWAPIDFVDTQGQHRGIAADYLRLIADRTGLRFSVVTEASFDDLLAKLMSGELTVGSSIVKQPERAERLAFSEPFFDVRYSVYARIDDADIQGIDDLAGRRVAIEEGFALADQLRDKHPEIDLVTVADTLAALEAVSWGKADAYIGNQAVALWLAQEAQISNLRRLQG